MCIDFLFRCEIPQCEDDTRLFNAPWLNSSMPFTSNLPEKCKKYQELSSDNSTTCAIDSFNRSVIVECRDNFIYEDDEITIQNKVSSSNWWDSKSSIEQWDTQINKTLLLFFIIFIAWHDTNQFDLTCNKEFYLSLIGTINNVGQLFCYLITGVISDR